MIQILSTYSGNFLVPQARPGWRSKGVPPGGPADPFLAGLALGLAGSDFALELTAPVIVQSDSPVLVYLSAPVGSAMLPGHPLAALAAIPLLPGEPLSLNAPHSGFRAYLSWDGMGAGRRFATPLEPGMGFFSAGSGTGGRLVLLDPPVPPEMPDHLRYIPVGDPAVFDAVATPMADRVGSRFRGQTPDFSPLARSEPSFHGAVQVAPGGEFLIHGPDGPTLGGYPKIGAVIAADLPVLAQIRPGQKVVLEPMTADGASVARLARQELLASSLARARNALAIAGIRP
ncbi:MAG: hypothetical protein JNM28_00790 [Armatimonadetes bacterium]|nr:hypothetical protein [Armatimonadota bacterium]